MTAALNVPALTREKQKQASDPGASVWVSANAGSGKTYVLTQRVARLLLQGAPPAKILCLTFTKAAAANMAMRIFETLANWTRLDDEALRQSIVAAGAPAPDERGLVEARRLFARTVETPGGLKIQTIHAFCERLLHLFPFEANAPARFEVADELAQAELLDRARRDVLDRAERDTKLAEARDRVAADCAGEAFKSLIGEALGHHAMARGRWPKDHRAALSEALGLVRGRDVAAVRQDMIENGIAPARWDELAAFLETGSKTDQNNGAALREAAEHRAKGDLDASVAAYLSIFFNKDGTPTKQLITNALLLHRRADGLGLYAEQDRLADLRQDEKAAATVERTAALGLIIDAIFQRYDAIKTMRGVLDYDDLIARTLALLARSDAAWVLYKLDSGIDHILIDEAQDTSAAQWQILERLTGDFAAGAGRSTETRTFFAVGDEKQSIFSFQGAAPHMFGEMRRNFEKTFIRGGKAFAQVRLTHSFRSAPGVLAAVDSVFSHPGHQSGLIADGDAWMLHEPLKDRLPGLVEIWAPLAPTARHEGADWRLPLDFLDEKEPASVVAQRVAQKIAALVAPGSPERVHDSDVGGTRAVRPGDILILVRTRGPFFDAVIRALKQRLVPVAGADRLRLSEHIAVLDLVAAGRAALLPDDDLNLAALLKSPLIGFDDDDLLAIAPERPASLFEALGAASAAKFTAARQQIEAWRSRAAQSPVAFYAGLLGEDGGRRALEARLGPEAADAIDEFLRLSLAHAAEPASSLAGFLHDFEGAELSIRRDMESGGDVVRVMTVHAAKGLEAKIVFLPDTCGGPSHHHDPHLFWLEATPQRAAAIAWSPGKKMDCERVAMAREGVRAASRDEYRRLLYVAMTRAEERLYIAGFHGVKGQADGCWWRMIEATLTADAHVETAPSAWNADESVLRLVSQGVAATAAPAAAAPEDAAMLPAWIWRRVGRPAAAAAPIRPSSALAAADRQTGVAASPARREALRGGALIHVLLQYLPDVPEATRAAAATAYLAARAADLAPDARDGLIASALRVIEAPDLAPLFGPDSKPEVAVAGSVALPRGGAVEIAGRIDRLGVAGGEVLVADFKTGEPCAPADIPKGYMAQMALYRAALAPLWPDRRLRMMLIWTADASVTVLDDGRLDAALAAIGAR